MTEPGTDVATRERVRPHEAADGAARLQATEGEIIVMLVREFGMERPLAAAWVRANREALEDARTYGCLELRRWLFGISMPQVDEDGKLADPRLRYVGAQAMRGTELLSRHFLGMTLEGAMEKVAKQGKGKAA